MLIEPAPRRGRAELDVLAGPTTRAERRWRRLLDGDAPVLVMPSTRA